MITGLVWETPDITQTDCRPCRSQNRPYSTSEINSFTHLFKNFQFNIINLLRPQMYKNNRSFVL